MTLIDYRDYDAGFISRRTGVGQAQAEDAINKLRKMQSALSTLKDLLAEESDDDDDDDDSEDHKPTSKIWKAPRPNPTDPTPQLTDQPVQVLPMEEDDDRDDWLSNFD
jgi:hypothetical protein